MDSCGAFLEVASRFAKRRYGARATVSLDESPPSFPDNHRWSARVRLDRETVDSRAGATPEEAVSRLAETLTGAVSRAVAADRAMLDSASRLGLA